MRLINDDRRRRVAFLAKRLEAFASARTALLLQLEALDAQANAAQIEHNTLHNLDAPIASLPDEVLAMIFEEGMHPRNFSCHFGVLVSHVTQHWRNVSIATRKLWTSIRAKSSPLSIYIAGFREKDLSSNFLQLISDHIGHCRQLSITNSDHDDLMTLLKCTLSQPTPFISSLVLGATDRSISFQEQLFPSGAPRLTAACLDFIDIRTIHHWLSAFESLTFLQLTCLVIDNCDNDVGYSSFRDAPMAMPSLHHLVLSIEIFEASPGRLPISLPMIQHLDVLRAGHPDDPISLDSLLNSITATSMVALSLSYWHDEELLELITHTSKPHFPSLQRLILNNVSSYVQHLSVLARAFPDIEQLTFEPGETASLLDIDLILNVFLYGASGLLWPKVQTIALSTSAVSISTEPFAAPQKLKCKILQLQAAGHPIRKLLLPRELHLAAVEMGEAVELEEFYDDWPTPFEWDA